MRQYIELLGLILIASFAQFATDIYISSLPAIADVFDVEINASQMSVASYMMALTVTQLFWGPFSDSIGRKAALYFGLVISIAGSILCASATSISMLILGRFIQGLGNGAAAGLFRAMLRDRYSGKELASIASYFANFLVLLLIVAPLLGGLFQEYFNWRASFVFLLGMALSCILVLKFAMGESRPINGNARPDWKNAYARLLSSRIFMGCCLANFLTYAGMFAWITSSSEILVDQMHLSPLQFGLGSGMTGAGLIVGSFINAPMVKRVGINKMLGIGWTVIAASGAGLIGASLLFGPIVFVILFCTFGFYLGSALIFANTNATAFSPFGDIAGTAAGLYAFIQLSGGAASSFLLASISGAGPLILGLVFLLSGALAWLVYAVIVVPAAYSVHGTTT